MFGNVDLSQAVVETLSDHLYRPLPSKLSDQLGLLTAVRGWKERNYDRRGIEQEHQAEKARLRVDDASFSIKIKIYGKHISTQHFVSRLSCMRG